MASDMLTNYRKKEQMPNALPKIKSYPADLRTTRSFENRSNYLPQVSGCDHIEPPSLTKKVY